MSEPENLQDKIKAMNLQYEQKQKKFKGSKAAHKSVEKVENNDCQVKMTARDKILVTVSIIEVLFYLTAIAAIIKFILS